MLDGKAWVDQELELGIQQDQVQLDELDVQLHAERAADLPLGGVAEPDQVSPRQARLALLGQGLGELGRRDTPRIDEDFAGPGLRR